MMPNRLTCILLPAPVPTLQINILPRLQSLQCTTSAMAQKSWIGRSHTHHILSLTLSPLQPHSVDSPVMVAQDPVPPIPSYLTRSSSDSDEIPYSESGPPQPFYRLPKASTLPDPSQFPDLYPFHTPPPIPHPVSLLRRAAAS
jgi:hypothetical protein